jgi:hypothetical protein
MADGALATVPAEAATRLPPPAIFAIPTMRAMATTSAAAAP